MQFLKSKLFPAIGVTACKVDGGSGGGGGGGGGGGRGSRKIWRQ